MQSDPAGLIQRHRTEQRGPREQNGAVIVPDGAGGAIVTWQDGATDIFAQHVLASGVLDPAFLAAGNR